MSGNTVPQFTEGELVNIAIRGARYSGMHGDTYGFEVPGRERRIWLPLGARSVTVKRVAPAQWPPRLGDIWQGNANRWCAIGRPTSDVVELINVDRGITDVPEDVLSFDGPMTLVYREGWTPATETAPAEPAAPPDRRTRAIAGMRALADLLESRPDLPWGYAGDIGCLVDDLAAVEAWAEALGAEVEHSFHEPANAMHHKARGFLAGQEVRMVWIEDLPATAQPDEPVEDDPADTDPEQPVGAPEVVATQPLPHRVPDDMELVLETTVRGPAPGMEIASVFCPRCGGPTTARLVICGKCQDDPRYREEIGEALAEVNGVEA